MVATFIQIYYLCPPKRRSSEYESGINVCANERNQILFDVMFRSSSSLRLLRR